MKQPDGTTEYVVPPRTIKEKIREALLAIKLEKTLSKDQILARYLNTIYLGHGAYGVQAAAQTYWGIDAADLSVKQSATLAGLITSPSRSTRSTTPRTRRCVATTPSTRWCTTATSIRRRRTSSRRRRSRPTSGPR